ncbi:hypothetical protein TNCV_599791 [Trichonephila clavipes]|nr:hypothetical protein TNCV_599791 [Trichonephila clavipes]
MIMEVSGSAFIPPTLLGKTVREQLQVSPHLRHWVDCTMKKLEVDRTLEKSAHPCFIGLRSGNMAVADPSIEYSRNSISIKRKSGPTVPLKRQTKGLLITLTHSSHSASFRDMGVYST